MGLLIHSLTNGSMSFDGLIDSDLMLVPVISSQAIISVVDQMREGTVCR